MLVYELYRHSPFAYRGGHSLYRAMAHVPGHEHAGHAGFEPIRVATGIPARGTPPLVYQVGPRENEAGAVAREHAVNPLRVGLRADENKERAGGQNLRFARRRVGNGDALQFARSLHACDVAVVKHFDIWGPVD